MFKSNEQVNQVINAVKEEIQEKMQEPDASVSLDDAKDVLVNAFANVAEDNGIDLSAIRDKLTD